MTIADRPLPPPPDLDNPPVGLRMSEEEFVAWYTFEGQAEWVDGEVVFMSPVSRPHDRTQWWVRNLLQFFVEDRKLGEVLGPEFTTRLTYGGRKVSRREPDILFVATAHIERLKAKLLEGPPDLAVEIVSPESVTRDHREKYLEYESAGVGEYWIIDPASEIIEAYTRAGEHFEPIPRAIDQIASRVLPGWYIRPSWLWHQPRTDVRAALAELGIK
jgi:Uma2 family endonuclease